MLLTVTTTHQPATDLGFLLHKNPGRIHESEVSVGRATVFYPEATEKRCTMALLVEVDPVGLVRGRKKTGTLQQYVNDRPYVASSFLSVALLQVFNSALKGRSRERPELVGTEIPLEVEIPVLRSRGGEDLIRALFEPLGYTVECHQLPLDEQFPEWGEGHYFAVRLDAQLRLSELLSHLYVLIPVLDNVKHYYVTQDEVDKLLRVGEGWLSQHPEVAQIVQRYLRHFRPLTREAMTRILDEDQSDPDERSSAGNAEEEEIEKPLSLNEQRHAAVVGALKGAGAGSVIDLGCGEGRLLRHLLGVQKIRRIVGYDVSHRVLEIAARRLKLDRLPERQRQRIELVHGSLLYRDPRIRDFDAACAVEVVEHFDPPRLRAFERNVFEFAKPQTLVLTTPNREYNTIWETLPAGQLRHRDHRFEWTRQEFADWAEGVAANFDYAVRFVPIGPIEAELGPPTQMAIFDRKSDDVAGGRS